MLKIGSYVMINHNRYRKGHYVKELDNLFHKVGRIVEIESHNISHTYYILDITKSCKFKFRFGEDFLIDLVKGV